MKLRRPCRVREMEFAWRSKRPDSGGSMLMMIASSICRAGCLGSPTTRATPSSRPARRITSSGFRQRMNQGWRRFGLNWRLRLGRWLSLHRRFRLFLVQTFRSRFWQGRRRFRLFLHLRHCLGHRPRRRGPLGHQIFDEILERFEKILGRNGDRQEDQKSGEGA